MRTTNKKPWEMTRSRYVMSGPAITGLPETKVDLERLRRDSKVNFDVREDYGNSTLIVPPFKPFKRRVKFSPEEEERILRALAKQGARGCRRYLTKRGEKRLSPREGFRICSSDRSKEHRLLVEKVLKEEKPVPEEVLLDYPDLAKRYLGKEVKLLDRVTC